MRFALKLLGTNGAVPSVDRFPTSQIVELEDISYMIDCGEGTQVRMQQFGVRSGRINQIFISHLHGDHVYGLIGLLTSLNLNQRTAPLQIYSPPGLQQVIEVQLQSTGTRIFYPLKFIEVDTTVQQLIHEDLHVQVFSIPLQHRIPTTGYLFREQERERNILPEKIKEYQLSVAQIVAAKAGKDIALSDGTHLSSEELTLAAPAPRTYAFCSDTMYTEAIVPIVQGVDLLYHEATFCSDQHDRAAETMHSTARQAATIAAKAAVGRLVMGHFSSRYRDVACFESEARSIFPDSYAGQDGAVYEVPFAGRRID